MKQSKMWALCTLGLFLALGCSKSDETVMAPLGDAAPEFGSSPELGTLPAFLKGRWCMVSMETGGKPNPMRYYEFKADGTFETGNTGNEWKSTGKWVESNGTINLTYETMNGKELREFQDGYRKDEEGGGQVSVQRALFYDEVYNEIGRLGSLHVDDDKKTLAFGGRPAPIQGNPMENYDSGGGNLGEILNSASGTLVRMGPKKKE